MLLWASYWSHSIDLTCKMIWDLNLYIGGSTDYQWMHINLVILWRTCNFGHLGEKKNDCQNQPMCTTENSAPATWRSPRIYMGSSMKSSWRGSKEKVFVEHGPHARTGNYFTYISHWNTPDQLHVDVPVSQMRRLRLGPAKLSGRRYIEDSLVPGVCLLPWPADSTRQTCIVPPSCNLIYNLQ